MTKTIELDYCSRWQFEGYHDRKQRWAVLVCHRRAGKTVATVCDLIIRACEENKHDGRYAMVAPLYNQVKDNAWSYLKHYARPLLAEEPREAELSVLLVNGAKIRLYGADNPDRLRGGYFDGVVLDEFADMKSDVWRAVVRPMLSDRKGWATIIGTPKGKNEFWRVYQEAQKDPDWFHMMLRASDSGIIPKAELEKLKIEQGEDFYQQEYENSFEAAIQGAFYANEMRIMINEGRICPIEIDKGVRVHTAWDLGVSDSTAIWFVQCIGRERRLVDYYESSGVGLNHYADVLADKRRQYGWTYGDHFFPHDIKVREFTSGKSRLNTLASLGIEAVVVPQYEELEGINVVRRMLGRTWIDPVRCERGLEALRGYRREYDERLKDWKQRPLHSWESHGADALRCFATGFDDTPSALAPRRRDSEPRSRGTHWAD
jgi:phage terminase large subunit